MGALSVRLVALGLATSLAGCVPAENDAPIRLVDVFDDGMVSGRPAAPGELPPRTEWRFEDEAALESVAALDGVSELAITDGLLVGRSTNEMPVLHFERVSELDDRDQLHEIEVRLRASGGANLSVQASGAPEIDPDRALQMVRAFDWSMTTPLVPGEDVQTYRVKSPVPLSASRVRHVLIRPVDEAEIDFAIESVRVIFRKEHLAEIPSGIGFQGMSEIYRESIVGRSPETLTIAVELPPRPRLDLALGTVDDLPVTFRVGLGDTTLLEQTVTTPFRWEERSVDLSEHARRAVELTLSLSSATEGAIGIWGTPVVRSAREDLVEDRPRGVVLLWADTLRRDHLGAYGYERSTSPVLDRIADEGVLFHNNVSQATWTKVSTPSLLTSLYPSSHGVTEFSDYLPASATTLAETYREAGYATASFASNLFTGQFTNLHQGFEVLHEDGSLPEIGSSKTAREYVDRLARWIERHRDVPFFAFVHLYDPHDPFEPRPPWNAMWADPAQKEEHEKHLEQVREFIADPLGKAFGMPSREELGRAGIDPDEYVGVDVGWYDGSIRGMDVEVGRVLEKLRELGLDEHTLVVVAADHGEEFLDHGRTFHGHSVYGELANVPLIFRWPGGLPAGREVTEVTETIDVFPTLLALSGLAEPDAVQGRSLVPLLTGDGPWQPRPAFTEKPKTKPGEGAPWPRDTESYAIVDGGWKLIVNVERKEGTPEVELYDAANDPLDQANVAAENPEVVERLREKLEAWRKMATSATLSPDDASIDGLSQQQLERLRSLGYIR